MHRLLALILWMNLVLIPLYACGTIPPGTRDHPAPRSPLVTPGQVSQLTARLLYVQADTSELWRMPLDGSAAEPILRLAGNRMPNHLILAPDGLQLAYTISEEPLAIHIVQLDQR